MKRLLLRLFKLISSIFKSHLIVYIENKRKLKCIVDVGNDMHDHQKNKEGDVSNETNNTNN